MIIEGSGVVAPKPRKVRMSSGEMRQLLLQATKQAEYRQYKARKDEWGKGLKGDAVIPGIGTIRREVRPILAGLIGEYASCCVINKHFGRTVCECDFRRRRWGDFGIDLQAFGLTMQVKTRQSDAHQNLVRVRNRHGGTVPLRSHSFVFCRWMGHQTGEVLGWQWTKDIVSLPLVDAIVGEHKNVELSDNALLPINRLFDALEALSCR